jgi:hypothetical protein
VLPQVKEEIVADLAVQRLFVVSALYAVGHPVTVATVPVITSHLLVVVFFL